MRGQKTDITNHKFYKLTAKYVIGKNKYGATLWLCLCDCKKYTTATTGNLRHGNRRSCGCLKSENNTIHGHSRIGKHSTEYNTWGHMKTRCYSVNYRQYKNYGGRGIKVCGRWLNSFEDFLADMGPKPGPEYSIDRINNDGDYCPENCKWSTRVEQNNNRRNMKWFRAYNKVLNAVRYSKNRKGFAKEYNLSYGCIYTCLKGTQKTHKGWSFMGLTDKCQESRQVSRK